MTELVARLRGPNGCPWDREQELDDLRPYLLEEAHEAAAAVDSGDWDRIREELGDLLFQVAFLTCLGQEHEEFTATDVIDGVEKKMIDRHPHVFGGETVEGAKAVREAWEKRKAKEATRSLLEGVPETLPALVRAYRVTQKASGVGFDWAAPHDVVSKLREELDELDAELDASESDPARLREEIGDVLFTVANLARHLSVDPEAALADSSRKFERRFESVERLLAADGRSIAAQSPDELERLWTEVKRSEGPEGR